MTNLNNYSVQRLLNVSSGLTKLFYYAMAGIENGGPDINEKDARQLTDLLNHQTEIQKALFEKVKNQVEPFEFDHDIYNDDDDTE